MKNNSVTLLDFYMQPKLMQTGNCRIFEGPTPSEDAVLLARTMWCVQKSILLLLVYLNRLMPHYTPKDSIHV